MSVATPINWPELKLVQQPYRHYVLYPSRTPIQWSVSKIAKGRSETDHLLSWATRLAVEEYESSNDASKAKKAHQKALEWSGTFGTLVHDTIEKNLTEGPCMPCDLTPDKCLTKEDVAKAALAVTSALTWLHNTGLEVVECERMIAHSVGGNRNDQIWYAGTFDLLRRDQRTGAYNLVDWKTSGAHRTNYFTQMGGYCEALSALGIEVSSITICRLPRSGGVDVISTDQVGAFRALFLEELRLHQRYHDAHFHMKSQSAAEYVAAQEHGNKCTQCETWCRYTTTTEPQTQLCVQCHAKLITKTESEQAK